jgi:PAS domain S-box-containing protein
MRVVTQPLPRYGVAVAVTAVALFCSFLLSSLGLRMPLALCIGAVIVSALQGGWRSGLVTTSLSALALAADYWIHASLSGADAPRESILLLPLFVVVGLLSSYLGEQCWRAMTAVAWVRSTLSCLGDGLVFTDADGHVTFINPAAQDLTGWKQVEAEGKPLEQVFGPLDQVSRLPVKTAVTKILQENTSIVSERALLVSNFGTDVHVDVRAAALRGNEGSLAGAVIMLRDVSAAWQEQKRLEHSEERLRSLVSGVHAAILELDAHGRCIAANRACQHLLGVTLDESLGEGWLRYVHAEDRPKARSAAAQPTSDAVCEIRFETPQHPLRWVRMRFAPSFSHREEKMGCIAALENITDEKYAQEHSRQTWALLAAAAEECRDALLVKNLDGQYLLANTAGARMLGKTVKEIIGKDDAHLVPADTARQLRDLDRQALASGHAQTHEHSETTKAGVRHYLSKRTPFHDSHGNPGGVLITERDVTDERCAQELLQESEQRLALEAKNREQAEDALHHSQAAQQALEQRVAELLQQVSLLNDHAEARQRAEDKLRESEARVQTSEERWTELVNANTALQEAVQQDTQIIEQRTTDLEKATAALEAERQACALAETSLHESQTRLCSLEEKVEELEKTNAFLQEEVRKHSAATPTAPQEEDFGDALFPASADAPHVVAEPTPADPDPAPMSEGSAVQDHGSQPGLAPESPPANGHAAAPEPAAGAPSESKRPHEWLSFN